jgi:hypothetical protein
VEISEAPVHGIPLNLSPCLIATTLRAGRVFSAPALTWVRLCTPTHVGSIRFDLFVFCLGKMGLLVLLAGSTIQFLGASAAERRLWRGEL